MARRPDPAKVLADMIDSLVIAHTAMRHRLRELVADKAKDRTREIIKLTAHIGQWADAIRKIEGARAKRQDAITRAEVLAYIRRVSPPERSQLVREAQAVDRRESVLA